MREMTRRQIEQHCLTLRDALGNLFPSIDDPSREYYWELLDELGKTATLALTARSEGFREGVKAAAWAIGELDGGEPERDRALNEAISTVRALSPRETDASSPPHRSAHD